MRVVGARRFAGLLPAGEVVEEGRIPDVPPALPCSPFSISGAQLGKELPWLWRDGGSYQPPCAAAEAALVPAFASV